jgi:bifunctional DNA-binding transcriptional regulator/antitoxin component of YhaV-PrlF toxin-antitoxin module
MRTRVSSRGHLVLPAKLRDQDGIEPGQEFAIKRVAVGHYRLVRRPPPANRGLVDWLRACPEKGFFVPIPSESTHKL